MKKVLLIYPKTGIDPEIPHPPLSLLDLGGSLEKAEYEPIVLDTRVDNKFKEKIKLNVNQSVCVALSCMTGYQITNALKIAKFVKELNPKIPIVWGGMHPTFLPEQTLKNKYVDIVLQGEGEAIFPELMKRLENNKSLKGIPSIGYKEKGKIILNKGYKYMNVSESKTAWHLVDVRKYLRTEFGADKVITLVTSKGCPHRCGFCYNLKINKAGGWRFKDSKLVLDEIEMLQKKYGINGVYFVEDNFFVSKKRVEEICKGLIDRNIKISWGSTNRVDYVEKYDDKFMELLKKSGCKLFIFGLESGSDRILKLINKDITIDQIIRALEKCKKFNMKSTNTFMTGFPTETKKDREATFKLIDRIHKLDKNAMISGIFSYMIFPGTPLYDLSIKQGFKFPETLEDWANYSYFNSSHKLSWLNKKEQKEINNVSFIVRFAFFNEEVEKSFKNPLIKVAISILRVSAKIRWKLKMFNFPIEWWAINKYYARAAS